MSRLRYGLYLTTILGLLTGCATSPAGTASLFLLPQSAAAAAAQAPSARTQPASADTVLALTAVQLAPYLGSDGIVYQTGANRIVVAASNQWAAPLQSQLSDGLYQTLNDSLADVSVRRPGPAPASRNGAYSLVVRVRQFQGRYDGQAVISGDWRLYTATGNVAGHGAFDQATRLPEDGYAALVRALGAGWQSVRETIADGVRQALAATAPAAT